MRVLSLFSGVGGLDLGLERAGHEVVGLCENDPTCQSILARHWPDIPLFPDVQKVGDEIRDVGPVDVVAGGSPCQDISVAGRRKGLAGERSRLFWHQCRVASRVAARWVLWENVTGVLSSNDGADFAAVLWGLTGFQPPVPADGWGSVGVCHGPERTAVWRVLDARWFGVAQRRRRVFVVASARDRRVLEVLVEPESVPRDSRPGRSAATVVAALTGNGVGAGGGPDDTRGDPDRMTFVPMTFAWQNGAGYGEAHDGLAITEDGSGPLSTSQVPAVAYTRTYRAKDATDAEKWEPADVAPTLNGFDNTSGIRATTTMLTELGVRRLTPRECERLMGWPDDWTRHRADGSEISDSQRYRVIGNGVASPVTEWIGRRLR